MVYLILLGLVQVELSGGYSAVTPEGKLIAVFLRLDLLLLRIPTLIVLVPSPLLMMFARVKVKLF